MKTEEAVISGLRRLGIHHSWSWVENCGLSPKGRTQSHDHGPVSA